MIIDKRREARILALQALCQLDVQGDAFAAQLEPFLRDSENERRAEGVSGLAPQHTAAALRIASELARAAWEGRSACDERVGVASEHWRIERMALVDRNLIRLGVSELLERREIPAAVVIDEAVEIAREFGDADSPRFVNGVLDAVWRRIERETSPAPGETTEPARESAGGDPFAAVE